MTAQIIAFTLYLAAGVAFAVWGVVRGGKKTIAPINRAKDPIRCARLSGAV